MNKHTGGAVNIFQLNQAARKFNKGEAVDVSQMNPNAQQKWSKLVGGVSGDSGGSSNTTLYIVAAVVGVVLVAAAVVIRRR